MINDISDRVCAKLLGRMDNLRPEVTERQLSIEFISEYCSSHCNLTGNEGLGQESCSLVRRSN